MKSVPSTPSPDWSVTLDLVHQLLQEQCPDLAQLQLSPFSEGWDNVLFRLGDGLLVRVPRRAAAVRLIEHEHAWLPGLAERLWINLPTPVFAGRPSEAFPRPWTVVPFLRGRRAADVPIPERTAAAEGLADFLATLHLPAPSDAPDNPFRGLSLDQPRFHERVTDRIRALGRHQDELTARWKSWSRAPEWDRPDVWVHGDLHPLNLLLDDAGSLSAVLDWGDVTAGDPACDLAAAWLTFDANGRRLFREASDALGLYDTHAWDRARAWALHLGLIFALNSDDSPALREVGEHALAALLAEPGE